MGRKHLNMLNQKAFSYDNLGYCHIKKVYKLQNQVTKEIREISREEFDLLYEEQKKIKHLKK